MKLYILSNNDFVRGVYDSIDKAKQAAAISAGRELYWTTSYGEPYLVSAAQPFADWTVYWSLRELTLNE